MVGLVFQAIIKVPLGMPRLRVAVLRQESRARQTILSMWLSREVMRAQGYRIDDLLVDHFS
jgi:hypothetical protein